MQLRRPLLEVRSVLKGYGVDYFANIRRQMHLIIHHQSSESRDLETLHIKFLTICEK